MKLSAVAIAVAFANGILLGVRGFDSRHAGAHRFLEVLLIGIGLGPVLGFFLAFLRYLRPATLLSLEYSILEENDPTAVHADVLKVGHHGSKNSTMPEFLGAVSPQIAIMSAVRENPYGHPSPELLQRL